jgi:hypothetical protein
MLYRSLPWLLFFGVFSWTPTPQSKPSDRGASHPLPLELILKGDHSVYRMSDTLRLEIQLRNISNEDVFIWHWDLCWNPARGLTMWIIGADGKTVQGSFLADCVPPPPRSGDPYQFVKVGPGNLYGLFENLKLSDYVNKPGEYDIYATFNSFLSADVRRFCQTVFGRRPDQQTSALDHGTPYHHFRAHSHHRETLSISVDTE